MKTKINFGGFYETFHDDIVERAVADYFGYVDHDTGEIDYDRLWDVDRVTWIDARRQYCSDYLDTLSYELGIDLEYHAIVTPRFYNFSTDVIVANINRRDILALFEYIRKNRLKPNLMEHIKSITTSSDGYHAFYRYDEIGQTANRPILIELMLDVIIADLGRDYPLIVDEFNLNYLAVERAA